MKVSTIIALAIGLVSTTSGAYITKSGKELPESFNQYFDCSNSDYWCRYERQLTCFRYHSPCNYENYEEYLADLNRDLGNLTAKEYCDLYSEVCDMTMEYNALTTPSGKVIPRFLLEYLNCEADDTLCKEGQVHTCNINYTHCLNNMSEESLIENGHVLDNYSPKEYCKIHEEVCRMIRNYNPVKLPSGVNVPTSLLKYFQCTAGDKKCQQEQSQTCMTKLKDCSTNMSEKYLTKKKHILGNLTAKQYCNLHEEVCQAIKTNDAGAETEVETPKDENKDDMFNVDQYLTCPKDDYNCKNKMNTLCYENLNQCWNKYPFEKCEALYNNGCSKIYA